jgi:hypothetical protein
MKNLLVLFLIFIMAGVSLAQTTPPSRYTTHYGLRCYSQGANPGSDSLNANWDDIDAAIYTAYDSANTSTVKIFGNQSIYGKKTFYGRPTFTGATFNSGSYGQVNFSDSITTYSIYMYYLSALYTPRIYPEGGPGFIGAADDPFWNVYSHHFTIPNDSEDDSVTIEYSDGYINFNRPIRSIDSTLTLGATGFGNQFQTIHADSVLSPNLYLYVSGSYGTEMSRSLQKFNFTEVDTELIIGHVLTSVQTGIVALSGVDTIINTINMGGSIDGYGARLTIMNPSASYNYTIKHGVGNIYTNAGGDVKLTQYQVIDLIEAKNGSGGQIWMQTQ